MPKPTRVAIYLRVSKDDGSQETDNQLLQLRGFCEGWESDRKFAELRRAYRCLLAAVIPWAIALYLLGVVPPPA